MTIITLTSSHLDNAPNLFPVRTPLTWNMILRRRRCRCRRRRRRRRRCCLFVVTTY